MSDLLRCESGGVRAVVVLPDGSSWCDACDTAARAFLADDPNTEVTDATT